MTTFVLLHGLGACAAIWRDIVSLLPDDCQCHTVDLPGHGTAPANDGDWAKRLADTMPDDAYWVGWSLGGMIAMMARQHGKAMRGVLAIATSPCMVARDGWPHAISPVDFASFRALVTSDYGSWHKRFLALQTLGEDATTRRRLAALPTADQHSVQHGFALLAADQRPSVAGYAASTAYLLGSNDALVPAAVADDIRAVSGDGAVTTIAGGHVLPLSRPQQCAHWILATVDKWSLTITN